MGKWRYGVILDAGSSGTRVYVYRWLNSERARSQASPQELKTLPELVTKKNWTKKTKPGVSTFGEKPTKVGPDHLAPLLEHALSHVPHDQVEHTPFFLLATAGMRLLPDNQRKDVLKEICSYVRSNTKFQVPDCDLHIQVIPGETEGLYGWVAANYLLGGFDHPEEHNHGKDHHTYGFLDMGGASAQIAFAPNATEADRHADDLKLLRMRTLNGQPQEYRVFVTTWLGFGANEARRRYIKALEESVDTHESELPDPCLPAGLVTTMEGNPVEPSSDEDVVTGPHLVGTGKFAECVRQTYPLLDKDKPCLDNPCLLGGMHVPAIDFDVNHFVGVSEYWHTTHEIFAASDEGKAYDFNTYQERVNAFCTQPWDDIAAGIKARKWGKVDERTVQEVCFKASWLINMLHDGIGIPRASNTLPNSTVLPTSKGKGFLDPFQAVNKIQGTEVSWTLGKMVLYASSQVPGDDFQPVGFGSNIPGASSLPPDFQFAGGKAFDLPDDLADEAADTVAGNTTTVAPETQEWHDVLGTSGSRRVPGLILFLLIVLLAAFLLCGRERRSSLWAKLFGHPPSRRGSPRPNFAARLSSKLGLTRTPAYERVLEEGVGAGDFDLPPYEEDDHSDASEGTSSSRAGKAPGWATPVLNVEFVDDGGVVVGAGSPARREGMSRAGSGLGLAGLGAFGVERAGLVGRGVSPVRSRSGKEAVD
ncbi:hypothetical protein EJ06DRAFT_226412 [Trichodelitschia bisporula]|uniref:Nucleoside diphosphatase n=1 Tax=Trichodelitschia bisporula TaxID=703511 RepID=A0A6G1HL18_9PEZI|nr:hypothetical protein EJ06DRAFT_226412 [Trichodelitschia bisporula]